MNAQIIALLNWKGDVTQTTICVNLAAGLAQAGKPASRARASLPRPRRQGGVVPKSDAGGSADDLLPPWVPWHPRSIQRYSEPTAPDRPWYADILLDTSTAASFIDSSYTCSFKVCWTDWICASHRLRVSSPGSIDTVYVPGSGCFAVHPKGFLISRGDSKPFDTVVNRVAVLAKIFGDYQFHGSVVVSQTLRNQERPMGEVQRKVFFEIENQVILVQNSRNIKSHWKGCSARPPI